MALSRVKKLISEESLDEALTLVQSLDPQEYELDRLIYEARIYDRQGDLEKATKYADKALKIAEERKLESSIIAAKITRLSVMMKNEQLELGLNYGLELEKQIDNADRKMLESIGDWTSTFYNIIGILYSYAGDLDQALEYYGKSLRIRERDRDELYVANSNNNIGEIYRVKGEIDLALDYYYQALDYYTKVNNRQNMAIAYHNIGVCHAQKGDLQLSLEYLKRALKLFEKSENPASTHESLYYLILYSLENNDIAVAKEYLEKIEKLAETTQNKFTIFYAKISRALILKYTRRLKARAQAQTIFEEIINEEIVDIELTGFALLNLCDLLLYELKMYEDEEILGEIRLYSDRLLKIAEEQSSFILQVEAYMIQSRIALLELSLVEAKRLLTKAQIISEVKGLQRLAIRISNDFDKLISSEDRWQRLTEENASLHERLEMADFENTMWKLIRSKIEIPEISKEEPILFMIIDEAGNSKYTRRFSQNRMLNETLIGVFLSAINSFSKSAFSSSQPIERIKHQEYTIILKHVRSYLFCYVFKGSSYYAVQKIDKLEQKLKSADKIWNLFDTYQLKAIPENETEITDFIDKIIVQEITT